MVMDIGRICVKLAGRDAGKTCVIVDLVQPGVVLIDGQTRRRRCNTKHLEPTHQLIQLKKGASHADVKKAFEELHLSVFSSNPKQKKERPRQQRAKKTTPTAAKSAEKKAKK